MKILVLGLALFAGQTPSPGALWAQAPAQPVSSPASTQVSVGTASASRPPGAERPQSSIADVAPVAGHPNLLAAGVPEVPEALVERTAPLLEARSARLLDVSPTGEEVLIATRFGQSSQLHVVDQPLGARTQITFGREPISQGAFHPADPMVVFYLQDRGGSENYQVYRLDRRSGRPEMLTDGRSRHEHFVLSPDGSRISWAGTDRNGRDTDVYVADTARPREARLLVQGEGTFVPVDFSANGEHLLVEKFRSVADADLFLVDVQSGEQVQLTPAEGKGSVVEARFSADGKAVFLVTDRYSDFNELYRVDLAEPGAPPRPLSRTIRWDVEGLAVARDGSRLALLANADGVSRLYFLEPKSGKLEPGSLPAGVAGSLRFSAKGGSSLFLGLATPRAPGDVWQVDLKAHKLLRWTRSEIGGLDSAALVEPTLVHYPAGDGLVIPALFYRPKGPGPKPVVIMWHGGPEGQERPVFNPLAQILLESGIAVLLPNVRGSSGYGKAYLAMDDGPKREQALGDIGATLDFVGAQPDLDSARVAVYGGSYGGYLALATASLYPGRIRSAVDVVGISSIPTFLESTAAYRRDLRRAEYGDERDPAVRAVQERISPLHHADAVRAALYVIQGRNDPRVPQSEAEQIVSAVRLSGQEVWYLLALDEGHGFQKKENRDHAFVTTVLFLERTLAQGAAVPPTSLRGSGLP
jgi:dipeptidyl aminopeptidase/acylaminoacyl peptidase